MVALVVITAVGLCARLYGLTGYGLWFDEAYHIELVKLPSVWAMLDAVLSNPPSDPLYVLLLRPWAQVFGTDAAAVRVLSVLVGTATVPATFLLGRYSMNQISGLIGALFFAVSPYAIEFGQEAALYTLAAFLTTLTLALGWRWLNTRRGLVVYVIAGGLAIYSHYVVAAIIILFVGFTLIFEIRERETQRRWLAANGLILLTWVPWLTALLLHWFGTELPRATIKHPATIDEVVGGLIQFTSGTASLQQSHRLLQISGLALALVFIVIGWVLASGKSKRSYLTMVCLFSTLYIAPALVSIVNGMWLFVPHFMLFLLPMIFVCFAAGLWLLLENRASMRRLLALTALTSWMAVQVWGIVLFNRFPPHGADGLQELAANIVAQGNPSQAVFVTPPALMPMLSQYYPGNLTGLPEDFDLRRVYIPFDGPDWYARSRQIIEKVRKSSDAFWLVYRPELDEGGRLLSDLRGRFTLKLEQNYQFSSLYLFSTVP